MNATVKRALFVVAVMAAVKFGKKMVPQLEQLV